MNALSIIFILRNSHLNAMFDSIDLLEVGDLSAAKCLVYFILYLLCYYLCTGDSPKAWANNLLLRIYKQTNRFAETCIDICII